MLLESSFKGTYARLAEHVFAVIFQMIFDINPPCMNDQTKESLWDIVVWVEALEGTYIRCFGFQISHHLMLQYVTNKVVMQEVENQLDRGLLGILHKRKKSP